MRAPSIPGSCALRCPLGTDEGLAVDSRPVAARTPDTTPLTRESYARILSLDEFERLRARDDLGTIVCTSGGFDPIHPGHVTCIVESKQFGDTLVVVVNGDGFL